MARYFRMLDDVHVPGRWYLVRPEDQHGVNIEPLLGKGEPLTVQGPVRVHFSRFAAHGRPVDYCELEGVAVAPIVHVKVANVLAELAPRDVQLLPAAIEGHPDQFVLVNVLRVVKCIDDHASAEVRHYTEADSKAFADQVGEYKRVIGMRINPTKVGDARVFRTWGWVAIVVAEEVKTALERIGTVGVKFEEV